MTPVARRQLEGGETLGLTRLQGSLLVRNRGRSSCAPGVMASEVAVESMHGLSRNEKPALPGGAYEGKLWWGNNRIATIRP